MKKSLWFGLTLILLAGLLAGCNSVGTDNQTPLEVVHLQTSLALAHWLPKAADCANAIPNLGIASEIVEPASLSLETADLILRLGPRQTTDPYTAVMGTESLELVAGVQVPLDILSLDSLQKIYQGDWTSWSEVSEMDSAAGIDLPLTLFSYPIGNEIETLFSQIYLDGKPITGNLQRYSTTDGLASLLAANPYGLGYSLASQVPAGFRTLVVTDLTQDPTFYVLAITASEPEGGLKQLLLCLQNPE